MKKKLFCWFLLLPCFGWTQHNALDSLMAVTEQMPSDTAKVLNLVSISNKLRTVRMDYPSCRNYAEKALALSSKLNYHKGIIMSQVAVAFGQRDMGNRENAILHLSQAISYFEETAGAYSNSSLFPLYINACTGIAEVYVYKND